ncbi:unnamed protein product [Euphydryas editha]|uniref:Uncharacterized protein n=1 Tax=Euphydryas editha TaxID=104508 RepID=A0AAU9TDX4_EUPED|nr:unnamed protein product [Euphydryas editha]
MTDDDDDGEDDDGVRKLNAILAAGARSGTWRIEVHCGGSSARVDLVVGTGLASASSATPAAEQHYVELKFADSMRRRYKPGLPFVGRVEAVSTEKRVRVRVKLYDDKTDIYSQDIDMSTGEGGFIVPTVMADAPFVNLQDKDYAKIFERFYEMKNAFVFILNRRWRKVAKYVNMILGKFYIKTLQLMTLIMKI